MSKKNKLIISIMMSLILITTVTLLFVFCLPKSSSPTKSAKITGNIVFEYDNVNATISDGIIEENTFKGEVAQKMQGFDTNKDNSNKRSSWQNLSFEFVQNDENFKNIVINFEITNNSDEKLFVNFEKNKNLGINLNNINIDITGKTEIAPLNKGEYSVTFSTLKLDDCLLENFDIKFLLVEEKYTEINGDIVFKGDNLNASISKGIIEDGTYLGNIENKYKEINFIGDNNQTQQNDNISSWKDVTLRFIEDEENYKSIILKFDITNNLEDRLFVNFEVIKGIGENTQNIKIEYLGDEVINSYGIGHYSIKFSCLEKIISKLDNFEISISLVKEEIAKVSGNINFVGENCNANIFNGEFSNGIYQGDIDSILKDFTLNEVVQPDLSDKLSSWKNLKVRFDEDNGQYLPITLEFDIKNNLEERLLVNFDIVKGNGKNSENIKVESQGQTIINSFNQEHYLLRFSCDDDIVSMLDNFSITLTLKKEEVSWVKGDINFEGEGFDVSVSKGSVVQGSVNEELENKLEAFSFNQEGVELLKETWKNLKLQFIENENTFIPIVLEFDIINNLKERLFVGVDVINGEGENAENISIEVIDSALINSLGQKHFQIRFICNQKIISKLDNFQINISFVKEEIASVNGNIIFEGEKIDVLVSEGTLLGGNIKGDISNKFKNINFNNYGESGFDEKLNSWQNLKIDFEKENFIAKPINLSFNITNNCEENVELGFELYKGLGINADKISMNLVGQSLINSNTTENYTISFMCEGDLKSILDSFSIKITILEVVTIKTKGKISFAGENIDAFISAGTIEEGSYIGDLSEKMKELNFNSNDFDKTLLTWQDINFKFVKNEEKFVPIVINFKISNNNYERYDLTVEVDKGDGLNTDNINIETSTIRRITSFNTSSYTIRFTAKEFLKTALNGWEVKIKIKKNYEAKVLDEENIYEFISFDFVDDAAINATDRNVKGKAIISSFVNSEENTLENLVIPAYIQNENGLYRVTSIKDAQNATSGVFANRTLLKMVSMPSTIENVGDYAFYNCSNLASVVLRKSIQTIGNYAFYNCSKLSEIALPDTVTVIGDYAFYNCSNIQAFTVSKTLRTVGNYAFYNCYKMIKISLPETVTTIGQYAFYRCSALTEFVIPSNVREIKDCTFYFCSSLTEISIPSRVRSIGVSAFESCYGIEEISLPLSMTILSKNAFYNCIELKSVSIGLNVREIGENVFTRCPKIESITINENNRYFEDGDGNSIIEKASNKLIVGCKTTVIAPNVTAIGASAFLYCLNLTNITIPENVVTIENKAFYGCESLESVNFALNSRLLTLNDEAFSTCKTLQAIELPDTVETIGYSCFFTCENLKSVKIGKYAREIASNAFLRCYALETIEIDDENAIYEDGNANAIIIKAENKLYYGCKNTIIPENIKIIASSAFTSCITLSRINIPAGIETIESMAFSGCSGIRTIVIDNAEFANGLTNKYSYSSIARYATTIYVKEGLSVGVYITSNFTLSSNSDIAGYLMYTK